MKLRTLLMGLVFCLSAPVMAGEHLTYQVSGMTCASCVKSIEGALNRDADVKMAKVDLKSGRAQVELKDEVTTPKDQIMKRLEDQVSRLGYKIQVKS